MIKKKLCIFIIFCTLSTFTNNNPTRIEIAHFELAQALSEKGDAKTAIIHYKKVLETNNKHSTTLFKLGCLLHQLQNYDGAIEYFKKRLQNNPSCAQTEFGLGKCWKKKGNIDRSIEHFLKAQKLDPKSAAICSELGHTLEKNNQLEKASQIYNQALKQNPNSRTLLEQQLKVLLQLNHYKKALDCCNKLFTLGAGSGNLMIQQAHLLVKCGQMEKAREIYKKLLTYAPNDSKFLYNIAHTYAQSNLTDQAMNYYQKSIAADPKNKRAYLGIAQTLLYEKKYKQGWETLALYNELSGKKNTLSLTENLNGKTVLISGEWMHEDMIQFASLAQKLQALGPKVVIQTPSALAPLFRLCPDFDDVVIMQQNTRYQYHKIIPLLSLPHIFGANTTNISANVPYLYADPELVQQWKNKLPSDKNLKIGIHLYKKSGIPMEPLFELARNNKINLCIIQTDLKFELPKNLPNNSAIHIIGTEFTEQKNDIDHLAAIIENLDLVITGDSTIAHLAGAMNCPVWVLLDTVAQWRWQADRDDCPWYPSMKLFRREKKSGWESVIAKVKLDIKTYI